jgi:hypothetical protein
MNMFLQCTGFGWRTHKPPVTWVQHAMEKLPLHDAPLTFEIALETSFLKRLFRSFYRGFG